MAHMNLLDRFRIGPKITGIVVLLLVLTALGGASGLFYLHQMNDRLNAIVDRSAEKVKLAAYLSRDLGDVVRAEKDTILAPDSAEVQQWANTTGRLLASISERQAKLRTLVDAEGLALLTSFDEHWQAYLALNHQVRALAAAGDLEGAAALSAGAARDAVSLATADMDALVSKNEADMDAAKLTAEASFGQARNLVLGFTGLGLLGGLALGLVVSHSISSNLGVMVHAAAAIADGDVGQEVAVESRDETGELAAAFRRMIAYLEEMAGVATRVASGDVEVQVAPRSEGDTLGLALRQMVSNLKEMAGVATRVAGGDLEVQVTPRSERDTLGLAMRQMVADLKQSRQRVSHLNAVLQAVRSINQLIVREKDRQRLIQGACDSLIETRGFVSAWIGLVGEAPGAVIAAQAGLGEDFAPVAEVLKRGELPPCGQQVLVQDGVQSLDVSPDSCPDCPLVAAHGSRLALGARLEHGGRVYGLLVVSFPEGFAFDEEERRLLAEVASDLAFGLYGIEQKEEIASLARFPSENPYPVLRIERDGTLLHANEASYALLRGWQLDIGQPAPAALREVVFDAFVQQLGRTVDTEHDQRVISFFVAPVAQAGYANLYGRDVTDRRQAEAALRTLAARQEALLAAIPDIIMEVDNNKVYAWANQAGIEFFGEDVIGKDAAFYFAGEQDTYTVVQPLFDGDESTVYVESWQRRKDGQNRLLAWWCRTLKDERGNAIGALSSARDITQIREAQQEIRQLNEELEQRVAERTVQLEAANKELDAFAYSVSHDLRAPLRGIDGWSLALLEDYYDKLDEQARQYLDRVRSEAQRMGRLIDDLLQLSRVTRAEVQTNAVDLTAMGQAVAARLQAAEPDRRVEVVIQPGLAARGDAHLLEVLLTNLLDNAWKFTAPRSLARVEFGQTEVEGWPTFYVRDNGVGFDMAFASKLFGAFQRLHRASEFPGTGIGLATVQRIVHRHGGRVWAEAHVDRGATFYFTLEEAP
jgi:PAS domain S-box-containing protein